MSTFKITVTEHTGEENSHGYEITKDIYEQHVDELDLKALVACVNKIETK